VSLFNFNLDAMDLMGIPEGLPEGMPAGMEGMK